MIYKNLFIRFGGRLDGRVKKKEHQKSVPSFSLLQLIPFTEMRNTSEETKHKHMHTCMHVTPSQKVRGRFSIIIITA
jgi:hypothetical protein